VSGCARGECFGRCRSPSGAATQRLSRCVEERTESTRCFLRCIAVPLGKRHLPSEPVLDSTVPTVTQGTGDGELVAVVVRARAGRLPRAPVSVPPADPRELERGADPAPLRDSTYPTPLRSRLARSLHHRATCSSVRVRAPAATKHLLTISDRKYTIEIWKRCAPDRTSALHRESEGQLREVSIWASGCREFDTEEQGRQNHLSVLVGSQCHCAKWQCGNLIPDSGRHCAKWRPWRSWRPDIGTVRASVRQRLTSLGRPLHTFTRRCREPRGPCATVPAG
jgi:hypothetical protein